MIPQKLKIGDGVRIIAPSRSLSLPWITDEQQQIAIKRLNELGLVVSFGKHVKEIDEFQSSSIQSRVTDIHETFLDSSIKLIITVIGGCNSNQILSSLNYDIIKSNPKILCGFSDITALTNAIYQKTGLVTYSGPHFITFGDKKGVDYSLEYFEKCLFTTNSFEIKPSQQLSYDRFSLDQENRTFIKSVSIHITKIFLFAFK